MADSRAAIAAIKKAGTTGKARSRHLQKMVSEVTERGGGEVKAHIGILANEAADVLETHAAGKVPLDDHEKWISGGVFDSGRSKGRGSI